MHAVAYSTVEWPDYNRLRAMNNSFPIFGIFQTNMAFVFSMKLGLRGEVVTTVVKGLLVLSTKEYFHKCKNFRYR